jgi:hypothetical protein
MASLATVIFRSRCAVRGSGIARYLHIMGRARRQKNFGDSVTSAAATRKTTGEVLCFGSSLVNPTRAPNIVASVGHYCIGGAALPILVILR